MPWVNTADSEARMGHTAFETYQIYNGLDCCVTLEVAHRLREELALRPNCLSTYRHRMDMLGPLTSMSLYGMRVNLGARDIAITHLEEITAQLQENLDQIAMSIWDKPLNPNSPKQLQDFFYGTMRLPKNYKIANGVRAVSVDIAALEKLELYLYARPVVRHIMAIRASRKLLGVLRSGIDADKRMRTSYNAGGTETGRLSSNKNVFGGGTNLQNITDRIRRIFEADKGWKLAVPDAEQAESRAVGGIMLRDFNDSAYHDACNSGDLHTYVSRLVWPNLAWTGDIRKDRAIAEQPFYRHFTYRDMAKRGGHGTNYYGKPPTIAKHLHVEERAVVDFQTKYLGQFHLNKWHAKVALKLQTEQMLITPFGMERIFFSRPDDDATLRKAIAFEPQSTVGEYTNRGLLRLWQEMPEVIVLLQIHDAIGFLYPDNPEQETEILTRAQQLLTKPIIYGTHSVTIPWEMKVGWNWGSYAPADAKSPNLDGLKKWKGNDERRRQSGRLDHLLSSVLQPDT